MTTIRELWRKLGRLGRRRDLERELAEEIRQHLEWRAQALMADGMPAQEAYRAARVAFGNPVALTERSREAWSFLRLETWLQDVAYGARLLWRDRGWALMAAATLALGIGGTVSIFTFVNAFLLRPLPFHEPDRLVHVWGADAKLRINRARLSAPDLLDLRREATLLADLAGFNYTEEDLTGGEPERVFAGRVTVNAFPLLGVEPAMGRGFAAGADAPGGPREVVLSDAFWRTRFDADPQVVGRVLHLDSEPHTVVGVMPPDVVFPLPVTQLWAPRVLDPSADGRARRHLQVFGRMKPGVDRTQAGAELEAIAARLAERYPDDNAHLTFRVVPLRDALNFASDIVGPMSVALGASAFLVFLIVCANVANLMLARGLARTHEMAVRAALGAGRGRLIRQLLTESALLAVCGGAAGVLVASWSLARIAAAVPPDLYRVGALAVDRDALACAVTVSALAVVLFGILPALRGTRPDPNVVLKDGGRTDGARHGRPYRLLVIGQLATSTVLLVAAALMLGSVRDLRRVPLGFQPDGVLTAKLVLPASRYPGAEEVRGFHARLLERAAALPGVEAAATVDYLPLNHEFPIVETFAAGTTAVAGDGVQATELSVSAGYFSVMGVPLLRGRALTDRDDARAAPVAVISEPLATALFGEGDAVDRTIVLGGRPGAGRSYSIVGVVAASRHRTLKDAPDRHLYLSQRQHPTRYLRLIVRAGSTPAGQATRCARRCGTWTRSSPSPRCGRWRPSSRSSSLRRSASAVPWRSSRSRLCCWRWLDIYGVTAFAVSRRKRRSACAWRSGHRLRGSGA
jgi:putative ABC transport system permease protein